MKSFYIFISICLVVSISLSVYVVASNSDSDITESVSDTQDSLICNSAMSPDGKIEAMIKSEEGMLFDSVLLKDMTGTTNEIVLENILYTSIESFTWIDNDRLALCGHVNPSLEVYVLIDANKKKILEKHDGIGFKWNKNKNKLYYVIASPYFGEVRISDKIVDNEGNTYYESEDGMSLTNVLAFSEDEQDFAFFINNNETYEKKLIIAKLEKDKKLKKNAELSVEFGDIKFNADKSVQLKNMNGCITNYKLDVN